MAAKVIKEIELNQNSHFPKITEINTTVIEIATSQISNRINEKILNIQPIYYRLENSDEYKDLDVEPPIQCTYIQSTNLEIYSFFKKTLVSNSIELEHLIIRQNDQIILERALFESLQPTFNSPLSIDYKIGNSYDKYIVKLRVLLPLVGVLINSLFAAVFYFFFYDSGLNKRNQMIYFVLIFIIVLVGNISNIKNDFENGNADDINIIIDFIFLIVECLWILITGYYVCFLNRFPKFLFDHEVIFRLVNRTEILFLIFIPIYSLLGTDQITASYNLAFLLILELLCHKHYEDINGFLSQRKGWFWLFVIFVTCSNLFEWLHIGHSSSNTNNSTDNDHHNNNEITVKNWAIWSSGFELLSAIVLYHLLASQFVDNEQSIYYDLYNHICKSNADSTKNNNKPKQEIINIIREGNHSSVSLS